MCFAHLRAAGTSCKAERIKVFTRQHCNHWSRYDNGAGEEQWGDRTGARGVWGGADYKIKKDTEMYWRQRKLVKETFVDESRRQSCASQRGDKRSAWSLGTINNVWRWRWLGGALARVHLIWRHKLHLINQNTREPQTLSSCSAAAALVPSCSPTNTTQSSDHQRS